LMTSRAGRCWSALLLSPRPNDITPGLAESARCHRWTVAAARVNRDVETPVRLALVDDDVLAPPSRADDPAHVHDERAVDDHVACLERDEDRPLRDLATHLGLDLGSTPDDRPPVGQQPCVGRLVRREPHGVLLREGSGHSSVDGVKTAATQTSDLLRAQPWRSQWTCSGPKTPRRREALAASRLR
jgi:hypothetical protein